MKKLYRFMTAMVCFLFFSVNVFAYSPTDLHYERFLNTVFLYMTVTIPTKQTLT